jgi:hypothetical protein
VPASRTAHGGDSAGDDGGSIGAATGAGRARRQVLLVRRMGECFSVPGAGWLLTLGGLSQVVVFERMATTWLVTAREMPAEVQKAQAEPTFARRMVACDKVCNSLEPISEC